MGLLVSIFSLISIVTRRGREFWKRVRVRCSSYLEKGIFHIKGMGHSLKDWFRRNKKLSDLENEVGSLKSKLEELQKQVYNHGRKADYSTRMVFRFIDAAYRLSSPPRRVLENAILDVMNREGATENVGGQLTIFYSSDPKQTSNPPDGEWVGYFEITSQTDETLKKIIKRFIVGHSTNLYVGGHKRSISVVHYIEARNELVLCTNHAHLDPKFDPYYW